MVQGKVSRVSKFGFQLEGDATKWFNVSKYEKSISLSAFSVGDTVEYEQNSKGYVTKLNKLQSANPNVNAGGNSATNAQSVSATVPAASGFDQAKANAVANATVNEKDLRITRLSALSTAFGALPLLKAEGDSLDDLTEKAEVLTEELVRYAMTGSFLTSAE